MKRFLCFFLVFFLFSVLPERVFGQETQKSGSPEEQDWTSLIEEVLENSGEERNVEDWQERFSELSENPVPLNSATKEMLESIPFLNEEQVESLSYYIYRFGPLASLSELLLIEGMDEQTLRWLKPFVVLGEPIAPETERTSWKNAFRYGKQEVRMGLGKTLQEKAGYAPSPDSVSSGQYYLGDPNQFHFRYGFNYKEKIQWGLVMEKDAGEKLFPGNHKGLDYLSFHFLLKGSKRIKTLIIGDYRLSFGQGLVCANSFSLGKSVSSVAIEKTGTSFSRHFSTAESGFFRGIGSTVLIKPFAGRNESGLENAGLEMTNFASIRYLDADISEKAFSSISTGELHRTEAESAIRNQLQNHAFGVHFSLKTSHSQWGLTGMAYGFNATFNPTWKPYNCLYFRGRQGGNASLDFRMRYKGMLFFGELAMDAKCNTACIFGTTLKPLSRLGLSLLVRNYAPAYQAIYGNAFSEGSSVQNEKGYFASCEWNFMKNWRLNAYYDLFIFPWLKYGINKPSYGSDKAIQTTWTPSSRSVVSIRFKTKTKEQNTSGGNFTFPPVKKQTKSQLRLQVYTQQNYWTLKTTIDGNVVEGGQGYSVSQEINYQQEKVPVSFSVKYALFDTDLFDNRIYSYERGLPGSFSMASYYGHGYRFSFLLNCKMTEKASLQIKIGHSAYRDRDEVGTALEKVQGNKLTDVRGIFLWKFSIPGPKKGKSAEQVISTFKQTE